MDPNETYNMAMDQTRGYGERMDSARDLLDWIENGGFLPDVVADGRKPVTALIHDLRQMAKGWFLVDGSWQRMTTPGR